MLTEIQTQMIPYEHIEISFARNRPHAERPPIPKPGDRVFYRREYWDQNPVLATVLEVQDLNDRSDPNLWQLARDVWGQPILDNGVMRYAQAPDPWPMLRLEFQPENDNGEPVGPPVQARTRESRMRGSPGWLPLNWRTRPVRLPSEVYAVERPKLRPVNVPLERFLEFGG